MSTFRNYIDFYKSNGYAVIPHFLTSNEIEDLKLECSKIVESMDPTQHRSVFSASNIKQTSDDYFINSVDKINFFFEADAFNDEGELVVDKSVSLNKIGHALHWINPVFKQITFSEKVKQLVKEIGFFNPVVPQSMYIFKNPKIGGKVQPHQDASFLHCEPEVKVIGVWLALEDATLENGCLWFVPGSHQDQLHTQWIRNPDKDPLMVFTNETPYQYADDKFVATPVPKGSCIVIHGLVVHKSEHNKSDKPRPIYTFHLYDQHQTQWDEKNWLQPTQEYSFPSLYDN